MVHLASVDQVLALAAADVNAVPFVAIEGKASDGEGLALSTGFFDPVIAPAGDIGAVTNLRDNPLKSDLACMRDISRPSTSKLSLNWMSVPSMIFLRCFLRSIRGQFPQIVAV
jgi:hypothetical protein